jgi:sec-independent protein translocase protein TatB
MLDIGWQEIFIVGVIAIIVIGPKDLPRALRTVMKGVKKARGIAKEFQGGVDEMVREADLDDLKKELNKATDGDIKKTLTDAIDPDGDLVKEMDMTDVKNEFDSIAKEANKDAIVEKPEIIDETPEKIDDLPSSEPEISETTDNKPATATNS